MRHRAGSAVLALNAAVSADGWISLFDVDMEAFVPRVPLLPTVAAPNSNMVQGVGRYNDAILQMGLMIDQNVGLYTPATWPPYVVVRCAYGTLNSNNPPNSTSGDLYDQDEVIIHGSQAQADKGAGLAGMLWFNFYPRGRMNRFGFQVEAGTDPLANFTLTAELWVVLNDGR